MTLYVYCCFRILKTRIFLLFQFRYYSYVLHFHAVMVGPTILFADYIDFIDGKQFVKKSDDKVNLSIYLFFFFFQI